MVIAFYWRHLSYQHGCLVMEVLFRHLDLLAIIDGRFGFPKLLTVPLVDSITRARLRGRLVAFDCKTEN